MPPDGEPATITTKITAPYDARTVSFLHTFAGSHPSLRKTSASTLCFLGHHLLADPGLRINRQFGDFRGGPYSTDSREIVTVAIA